MNLGQLPYCPAGGASGAVMAQAFHSAEISLGRHIPRFNISPLENRKATSQPIPPDFTLISVGKIGCCRRINCMQYLVGHAALKDGHETASHQIDAIPSPLTFSKLK
jgi:hypothetical protein